MSTKFYHLINGERIGGNDWIVRRNPANTDEVVSEFPKGTYEIARSALEAAAAAFPAWATIPAPDRGDILFRAAELIGQQIEELTAIMTREEGKTLARFDFNAVPGLNRTLVMDLATCAFLGRQENLLICGPTGIGKSHVAEAILFEAVKRGHRALMRPVHQLLGDLQAGRADGTHKRRMLRACTVDLLVLDDFGLRPLTAQGADDLYEIVAERYEKRSTVITSNRAMEEWPEVFGNELLANAALDRLTHRAQILIMRGQSYRQRGRRKEVAEPAGAVKAKAEKTTE